MTKLNVDHQYSLIDNIINEASSYENFNDLERLVDQAVNLKHLPVQPLYIALKDLGAEQVGSSLALFDHTQRRIFLDLDLWEKDEVDVNSFAFWIRAYASCNDDKIVSEFVNSEEFLLYLKSAFNIWTFDSEEPEYPDHDFYFLSEDQLLLFEYHKDYPFVDEIKNFLKVMYSEMGVENAYVNLFKVVSDGYLEFQEQEFQLKKSRLEELGLVEYYDSLQTENCFSNMQTLQNHIKNKKRFKTPEIDEVCKTQGLHSYTVAAFLGKLEEITKELLKVREQKRKDFLQFNFIRLVNSRLSFRNALKEGRTAMMSATRELADLLLLGFDYLKKEGKLKDDTILFEVFDFFDIYKIGHSLITLLQKDIKKSLRDHSLEELDQQAFLGYHLGEILDALFDEPAKVPSFKLGEKNKAVFSLSQFVELQLCCDRFLELIPFAQKMRELLNQLKREGKIQDEFYYNMRVEDIDFESLILSSFALFVLAGRDKNFSLKLNQDHKLGLTIAEFKLFIKVANPQRVNEDGDSFAKAYGLAPAIIVPYLKSIMSIHLDGHDWSAMSITDFKHVGGPIILVPL